MTAVLGDVVDAVAEHGAVVLTAPPGTGKTTLVPPALARAQGPPAGRVLLVVPRRIAARAAASRMAALHEETLGETFGYSVRGDRRTGPRTRVEAVTPGLLLRRLQADPELAGVSTVVLDEFHERSVDQDMLLAFLVDVRSALRPDLGLLVMSATLDAQRLSATLGGAPVLAVESPLHEVVTTWHPGNVHEPLADRVGEVVLEALGSHPGDVLVFLPGRGEIRAVDRVLGRHLGSDTRVMPLHGTLSASEQDEVLAGAADGQRRVVLATSIAETSLTVPGVRIVVDTGLRRSVRVDPATGLPSLDTTWTSLATAEQRRGRAAREAPGRCLRMWARRDEETRRHHDPPEVLEGELSGLLLSVRAWGARDPGELGWLDPPPAAALENGRNLLRRLGALDDADDLTALGRRLAAVGFHPRVAAIAVRAAGNNASPGDAGDLGARLLAVLETSESTGGDLATAVERATHGGPTARAVRQWKREISRLQVPPEELGAMRGGAPRGDDLELAELVLAGYPDRIARRREGRPGVYLLSHGGEVEVPAGSAHLVDSEWLVAMDLDTRRSRGGPGRLHLGCAVPEPLVEHLVASGRWSVREESTCEWDPADGSVRTRRTRSLGAIELDSSTIRSATRDDLCEAVVEQVSTRGPSILAAWEATDGLRSRLAFVRTTAPPVDESPWPDLDEEAVRRTARDWVPLLVGTAGRHERFDPRPGDLERVLLAQMTWHRRAELDRLAPLRWSPSGTDRDFRLSYGVVDGDPTSVLLSARLAHLLGVDEHPTVGPGRIPVVVELLSPAGRPLQRTRDLPGFWRGSYAQVRSEMRGRYPKHPWPERPWEAG